MTKEHFITAGLLLHSWTPNHLITSINVNSGYINFTLIKCTLIVHFWVHVLAF